MRAILVANVVKAYEANDIPVTPDVRKKLDLLEDQTLIDLAAHWYFRAAGSVWSTRAIMEHLRDMAGINPNFNLPTPSAADTQYHGGYHE